MKRLVFIICIALLMTACTDQAKPDKDENKNNEKEPVTEAPEETQDDPDEKSQPDPKNNDEFKGILNELKPSDVDEEAVQAFTPQTPQPGNYAAYDIEVDVNTEGWIDVTANIQVENLSDDQWDKVAFHFLPHAFLEENKPSFLKDSGLLEEFQVKQNGNTLDHTFGKGYFTVKLNEPFSQNTSQTLSVSYKYQPPMGGLRLSRTEDTIILAQWYPMLAPYQNNEWNVNDFHTMGESYFTSYGEYDVTLKAPDNYLVATTAVNENHNSTQTTHHLEAEKVPDFLIGLFDKNTWGVLTDQVNDQTIRIFYTKDHEDQAKSLMESAKQTLKDFQTLIGPYPYQELDILANGGGMEYPRVIEVSSGNTPFEMAEHTLIHEIAHQWFYFQIIDDPYNEGWLDETLTELATSAYLMKKYDNEKKAISYAQGIGGPKVQFEIAVNQPLSELGNGAFRLIYGDAVVRLWEFFKINGGHEAVFKFLNAYYDKFQHKQVTTEEFVRFFQTYHEKDYSKFLDWFLEFEKK